jgi:phage shock protein A
VEIVNVFTRVKDLATATWQEISERSVAPEREVENFLSAQQKHLAETDILYQQTVEQAIALREQLRSAEELSERRGAQAQLAMKAGEEELARLAVEEKLHADNVIEHTRVQYERSQSVILQLVEELALLRAAYAAAIEQREVNAVRLESARLQQQMQQRESSSVLQGTLQELKEAGRDFGRDFSDLLREASVTGRESFRAMSGKIQRELKQHSCNEPSKSQSGK